MMPSATTGGAPASLGHRFRSALPTRGDLGFALTTSATALAALGLAMDLELDAPYWAGAAVLITAQATRAQGLLKGVNRLIGTIVGATASVVLIALVPQGWWGYLGVQLAWLVLCTFASCLFREMQSYAAALSGYTALIVAMESFGRPERTFEVAVSRGSAVALGVTLFVVVTLLVHPGNVPRTLRGTLSAWADEGLALSAVLLRGRADEGDIARFLPRMADLDAVVENGATEASWIVPLKPLLRGALLSIATCVLGAAHPPASVSTEARHRLADQLDRLRGGTTAIQVGGEERPGRADAAEPWADAILADARVVCGALTFLGDGGGGWDGRPVGRAYHRDMPLAVVGAIRTALATGAAAAIWVLTRWPDGGPFLEMTGLLCCLYASRPSPLVAGRKFALGTVVTSVVAFAIGFLALPGIGTFEGLAATLFPVLFLGALGIRTKALAPYMVALNFFFLPMMGIRNQMGYDPSDFLNQAVALVAGSLHAVLWFQLVPSPSSARQARWLIRSLERGAGTRSGDEGLLLDLQRFGRLLGLVDNGEARRLVHDALSLSGEDDRVR